ncbi:MAG TPA: hypothetical protein VF516_33170, partial [Kofleriaceae bacterium]
MYQSYQLIGYQTPTTKLGPGDLVNLDAYADLIGDLKTNDGWLSDIKNADMKKRLARLIGVVEQAHALQGQQVSNDQTTLKVFLVPEFYFRPTADQGVQSSYSDAERDALVKVLDRYVKAERFKHWLFVFGTVIWQIQVSKLMANAQLPDGVKLNDDKAQAYVIKNTTL